MYNLLYKEFKLTIHPFYYVLPVFFGALMLIPQWIFFLVPLYFCFITVPQIFSLYKSNNDLEFSIILPVRKSDIVKTRILSIAILELFQIACALFFALIHRSLYKYANFAFDLNAAFFGLVFVMFALYNIILFPMFYKTAFKFGAAVIVSTVAAIGFAFIAEMLVIFNESFKNIVEGKLGPQIIILAAGMVLFVLGAMLAYKISVKSFEKVDV
jgi:ABC-2 type transport system permease protein